MDCGSSVSYTDPQGKSWAADQAYVAGSWGYTSARNLYSTSNPIAGTVDDTLYQTMWWSNSSTHDYKFDVPAGTYRVTLKCSEPTAGFGRTYNVLAEGQVRIANLNVYQEAGGSDKALDKTFDVQVTDGTLDFSLQNVGSYVAIVQAIEVLSL